MHKKYFVIFTKIEMLNSLKSLQKVYNKGLFVPHTLFVHSTNIYRPQ